MADHLQKHRLKPVKTTVRIALVGADTLLGKELREQLEHWSPRPALELISSTAEDAAILGLDPEEEELVPLSPLRPESLEGANVAFLAGSQASSRRALKNNSATGPVLIDLTGALEDQPQARLRAPLAYQGAAEHTPIQVIANPAAAALAALLTTLSAHTKIVSSLAHIFEPASERGKPGLKELQQQTVSVLAFKKLKKDVFDAQVAFNLLARLGDEAVEPTESIEARMNRHLASLLASVPAVPMPSLRLIHTPTFHGQSLSVWIEFASDPGMEQIVETLESAEFDVRPEEPPNNAAIAGQSGISVGAITADANRPNAYWFWLVADNLKLTVDNAVAVAKEYV